MKGRSTLLEPADLLRRLRAGDGSLWPEGNVAGDHLGWLEAPRDLERQAADLAAWSGSIDQEVVVVLGVGGEALGPLALGAVHDALGKDGRHLVVCDSTDPATIAGAPIEEAFVLVTSLSGTTLETGALFAHARARLPDMRRYAVVTGPGTPLAREAEERGVHRLFLAHQDIGGRYSALSHFGVVAASLAGYDVAELCGRVLDVDGAAAVSLGLEMGLAALEGQDKTTFVLDPALRPLGLWLEELVAGSTGKSGTGCVPIPTGDTEAGEDRHVVTVGLESAHEIGEVFYRFELAAAAAGYALGVDPFDEPDVASSKAATERLLDELPLPPVEAAEVTDIGPWLEEVLRPRDYLSVQAYLPYGSEAVLETVRKSLRDHHGGLPVTVGYGPRLLHGAGQLHKGGPDELVALQIVAREPGPVVEVPSKRYDFGTLLVAQADGDLECLRERGRRVLRVAVGRADDLL